MSDSRRRRRFQQSGESDGFTDSNDELDAKKESKDSGSNHEHPDSEYDSTGSESNSESQDGIQRESGDGQEEKPQKKLDDDEDRRNPQYIPKRGTFYEHDDRTADEVANNVPEIPNEREVKDKKVWKDKEDRWNHDRYNDEEQSPKSRAELVAAYGYDIRKEEGPPKARRRRKYGRGPNKYERNWEDEDAYGKVSPSNLKNNKKPNTGEEFPALRGSEQSDSTTKNTPVISSAWYSNKNKSLSKPQNFVQRPPESHTAVNKQTVNSKTNENQDPKEAKNSNTFENVKEDSGKAGGDAGRVLVKSSPRDNKKYSKETVNPPISRSLGRGLRGNMNATTFGNGAVEARSRGRGYRVSNADNRQNTIMHQNQEQIINDMKHMNISSQGKSYHQSDRPGTKHFYPPTSNHHDMNWAPPQMQQTHLQQQQAPQQPQQTPSADGSGNRPKRYSSLRQKPTISQNPGQQTYQAQHTQHPYYPPPQATSSRSVLKSQGYPSNPLDQAQPVVSSPTDPLTGQPLMTIPPGAQPGGYPPTTFLVPTPQFIPAQTPPNIINYVPGPNGPIFQPNYQSFNPAVPPPGPPPPQELYQPQGCTYYSPAQQQNPQQQVPPLRRPKAAIPILPPPESPPNHQSGVGRGRTTVPQHLNVDTTNERSENNVRHDETEEKKHSTDSETIESESNQFDDAPIAQLDAPKNVSSEPQFNELHDIEEVKTEVQVTIAVNVENNESSLSSPLEGSCLDKMTAADESVEIEMNTVTATNTDQVSIQKQEVQEAGA